MKQWLLFMLMVLVCVPAVLAAPAYGTRMPKAQQAFWGLQSYTILSSDLNRDQGSMKSQQEHILLSYGVADWLSLDLKWSGGTIEYESGSGDKTRYHAPLWGGGYGFRVRLYENGPVKVVSGFQHISIHPKTVRVNGDKHNAILDDWQGSALVSYAFKRFMPYAGLRYGTTDYIHRVNNDRSRAYAPESRRFDAILGVDVPVSEKVWINLEGTVGGGEAVAASLNFHF